MCQPREIIHPENECVTARKCLNPDSYFYFWEYVFYDEIIFPEKFAFPQKCVIPEKIIHPGNE